MTQAFQAQLIQSAPDGILAFDRECRYLLWNPAMEKLSGLSAKEVLGKVAFDVFPFLKEIGEDQFFLRALQGEVTVSLGRPFEIPSSGKRGFFEGHYSAVLDESGEIVGGMAVIRNVTSRNLEELDFAEKRFHEVIEQAPISIQILSPEGKTLRVNPAWRKLANLSEDFIQNYILKEYNIITDPLLEKRGVAPLILKAFHGEPTRIPPLFYDPGELGLPGTPRWLEAFLFPIKGPQGQIRELMLMHIDVTDKMKIEDELRGSRDQLQTILENVADGIIVQDQNFKFVYANEVGARLCGFRSVQEMIAAPLVSTIARFEIRGETGSLISNDELPARRALKGERESPALIMQVRNLETHFENWSICSSRPIFDLNGKPILSVSIFRDITKQKQDEQELRAAIQARDEFISIASHELKTPLTTLRLRTDMALKNLNSGKSGSMNDVQVAQLVAAYSKQIERLSHLVEDMLDISRIRLGKLIIRPESFDLSVLVAEVLERLNGQHMASQIEIKLEACPGVVGSWDKYRLEQVLSNLVINAIKYGNEKPISISVKSTPTHAVLEVADHGIGIAKSDQPRIFERFERAVPGLEISGLGLGLYIVKQIIAAHGGSIEVESTLNRGSTFRVSLPL